jgi:hypothetical protein
MITPRPSNYALYKYTAVYGRANYTLDDTYILNATFRRDGSTRFGPGRRFGNFGSIGAAWIFTNESFMPKGDVLSFGKLRGSYGTSGNDNVGNYQYLASWSPTSFPYDGVSGLTPSRIPNPDYNWEVSKKLDIGLDLGFFHDKVLLNAGYYRNISDNQLVDYALTPQTGMSSITANFPAKVLNNGWEFELNTTNISGKHFTWKSSLNLTIARNKLLEFPGIESSSYSTTYIVGQSLNIVQGFQFTGVDPATGVPKFFDKSKDGSISDYDDYVVLGKTDPSYYGGFQNNFTYKQFQLDFLFQFVKQEGPTVNYGYLSDSYGAFGNKDLSAQNRWRKSGDITDVPRASLTAGNAAYNAYRNNYRFSSAVWGNASYIRLKNISLRYDLSAAVEKWKIKGASIFVQAQNLITITNYKGFDPETQGVVLPPLKTLTAGLQFSF